MLTHKEHSDTQTTYVKIKNRVWNDPLILCPILLLNATLISLGFIGLCMLTYNLSINSLGIQLLAIWGCVIGAVIFFSMLLVPLEIKCVASIKHLKKIAKKSPH